ncbi:MAG: hypothetical protein NZ750_14220 [Anaerolineae bacterium]|nr:hypothetical protein [Anaerolineae bacterium]MDW8173758.1 hypothetical protein [Anaerolineae bacterium]
MPPYSECETCIFYQRMNERDGRCAKHSFVMPHLDWQTVCSSYMGEGMSHPEPMDSRTLYYFGLNADFYHFAPLAPFAHLRAPLLSVNVRRDHELGWIIYPRKHLRYFPSPDSEISVVLNDQAFCFYTYSLQRTVAYEILGSEDGTPETLQHVQTLFMLGCPQRPDLLYEWTSLYYDTERLFARTLAPSLMAFLEVVSIGQYILHPDSLLYGDYLR